MSRETYQIFENMDQKDLKTQLAFQCSTLLTGIKISNLFIVHNENAEHVNMIFQETQISAYVIYKTDIKTTFLLYRKEELESYIHSGKINQVMHKLGYRSTKLNIILGIFSKRYSRYMKERGQFPHEMGLLLGYPEDDVVGFIENNGKNFLYTGYWKVYSNLSEAMCLFEKYNQAKEMVIGMVLYGVNILEILDI